MSKLANIPTNIITGFLGVGKTTAINSLLAQKPADETWAILVNEFGQIGIDQAVMENQTEGVAIKELAGGCICCALGPALTSTLALLLRRSKPDRLLIEPTGIGHPAGIIDTLQNDNFKEVLDLRSVICLLDPRALDNPEVISNPTFQDQINLADVIVLNKIDLASEAQTSFAEERSNSLFPPKQAVVKSIAGQISLSLLDLIRKDECQALFPDAHTSPDQAELSTAPQAQPLFQLQPKAGLPLSKEGSNHGLYSCGWVLNKNDIFIADKLISYLQSLPNIQRIKGVFHTQEGWVLYNQAINETTVSPITYRRDSRVEIITTRAFKKDEIQQKLIDCLHISTQ
ncbi:MAG: G3E family GTPase [Neptuniibacter pectenicola]|jgi:G3E family GTPase|uniref:CobW family GTP-binding protein n=1 Tax=Neptuniibacter pectenicola TaxID=1806669 RepID=UPI003ADBB0A6